MKWTAAKIKGLREAIGETQEQFAKRLGVTDGTVSFWEKSTNSPRGPACLILDQIEQAAREGRISALQSA